MDNNSKTIKINNFNLSVFGHLLNQSLMVTTQIMIEFNDSMIKSCSFSATKSSIKLWTIPINSLINKKEEDANQLSLDIAPSTKQDFSDLKFNFYILKGDLFKKYISVHNTENVDLEFNLVFIDKKYQASSITITGKSETGSPLKTTFILTTEELITNKISDYSQILAECTPNPKMIEIVLNDKQIQEIKGLTKKLHKAVIGNSAYLTFSLINNLLTVKDKVFNINFGIDCNLTSLSKYNKLLPDELLEFNILKSDFIITGNHTFNIFASNSEDKVIMGGKYAGAIIWCLTTKISENQQDDSYIDEESIDSLDLNEYIDIDDLPF